MIIAQMVLIEPMELMVLMGQMELMELMAIQPQIITRQMGQAMEARL